MIRTNDTVLEQITQAPSTWTSVTPQEPAIGIFFKDVKLSFHEFSGCGDEVGIPFRGVKLSGTLAAVSRAGSSCSNIARSINADVSLIAEFADDDGQVGRLGYKLSVGVIANSSDVLVLIHV